MGTQAIRSTNTVTMVRREILTPLSRFIRPRHRSLCARKIDIPSPHNFPSRRFGGKRKCFSKIKRMEKKGYRAPSSRYFRQRKYFKGPQTFFPSFIMKVLVHRRRFLYYEQYRMSTSLFPQFPPSVVYFPASLGNVFPESHLRTHILPHAPLLELASSPLNCPPFQRL